MREISIKDIAGIKIGQTENTAAATGCTVFVSEKGMPAGADIRGGGPASRETQLLNPLMNAQFIHAVVFAGGSAYGLGAANGVMSCLEERGIGLSVGPMVVPLVVQTDIFDLGIGDGSVRPDPAMGYEAARCALDLQNYRDGNYGAGCGATVGKIGGRGLSMKSGIGSYAVQAGDLQVGAVVVVNAVGDIFDHKTGQKVAGALRPDRKGFGDTFELMMERYGIPKDEPVANTTLGIIITNAAFDKAQLCKIAGMAHDGYARSINPVHTAGDGDSIFAVSVGDVEASRDLIGVLGAEVMSEAILRAVRSAGSAYGVTALRDLDF